LSSPSIDCPRRLKQARYIVGVPVCTILEPEREVDKVVIEALKRNVEYGLDL